MTPLQRQLSEPRVRAWMLCTVGIAALGATAAVRYASPRGPLAVRAPIVIAAPAPPAMVVHVQDEPSPVDDEAPAIEIGVCRGAGPIDRAAAEELRAMVTSWISNDRSRDQPGIEYRRGVLFIESEEDRGDDPPYPRSAAAESARVCGTQAQWMRSHVREVLARKGGELTCSDTACCYGGMEYAPSGDVTFRRRDGSWMITGWVQSQVAGLSQEYSDINSRYVGAAERRLRNTSCPGEADVHD